MNNWLFVFLLFVVTSSYGQSANAGITEAQLLKYAYDAASSLPPDLRIHVLAGLVPLASQSRTQDSAAWTDELERLAEKETDECQRADYKAIAVSALAVTDVKVAMQRLSTVEAGCGNTFLLVAGTIFEAAIRKSKAVPSDALISAAMHLGEVGDYPYRAIDLIFKKLRKRDKEAADRLVFNGILAYKNKSALEWSTHDAFVVLLSDTKDELPKETIDEGVDLAIRRISEYKNDEKSPLLHMTMLMKDSSVIQIDQRERTLAKLYSLAQSVDERLAGRMKELFPTSHFTDFDESQMVAGIGTAGASEMKPGARFFMELANLRNQLQTNAGTSELEAMGVKPALKAAYLALRASDESKANKPESADHSFAEAQKALDSVKDESEKLRALAVMVEASVRAVRYKIAEDAIAEGFGIAPRLLKEELKDNKIKTSASSTISPLRRMARACAGQKQLILPELGKLRDAELQSYLYLTLAEASIERKQE